MIKATLKRESRGMAASLPQAHSHERSGLAIESETIPPITEPYALFVCVALEIDEQGRRWTIATWAKDLALHLDYLTDLTLVSPAIRVKTRSAATVSLDEQPFDRLKFIDLPCPTNKWEALKTLPEHLLRYWQAIGPARVVHSGFAGWPIIQAWIAVPLAKLRGRFALGNVESSPWRASGAGLPRHKRLRGSMGEVITRATLRMADLKLLTSKQYYKDLLQARDARGTRDAGDLAQRGVDRGGGRGRRGLERQGGPRAAVVRRPIAPGEGGSPAPLRDRGGDQSRGERRARDPSAPDHALAR